MSRTYRNETYHRCVLRKPRILNEKTQLGALLVDVWNDDDFIEIPVSKLNRVQSKYSSLNPWADDKVVSSYYETDWSK